MYNSINPINITYRNPRQANPLNNQEGQNAEQTPVSYEQGSRGNNREFPNGTKVAIDYTKNTVNISQIVADFKSTVIAIGAPDDISDEVNSYLSLVERESKKQNPSREIIFSNLINASKISDKYIHQELSKKNGNAPKNVVEGWIDALFKQKVDLKADPTQINPDFQLDIPERKKPASAQIQDAQPENLVKQDVFESSKQAENSDFKTQIREIQPFAREIPKQDTLEIPAADDTPYVSDTQYVQQISNQPKSINNNDDTIEFKTIGPAQNIQISQIEQPEPQTVQLVENYTEGEDFEAPEVNSLDEVLNEEIAISQPIQLIETSKPQKPQYVSSEHDRVLSKSLKEAKTFLTLDDDPASALETLNDALGEANEDTNPNLRAALHFERGKIFDDYDYVNYALRDFYEATKCEDNNLKSQAHLKMARIYDDYVDFEPALEHYQDAVGYSGEASNIRAQTKILTEMSSMFADRYDAESTRMLADLSIDAAYESGDAFLISKTYTQAGRNYEYLGEDFAALDSYKNAVKALNGAVEDIETYELCAQSYEDAAGVMDRLGNITKAENLLSKARLYRQRAQLAQMAEAV